MLLYLRHELYESGIDAANDLVVTQENAQLGSSLPFYISTKVPDGNTTKRVYSYNVSAEFRNNIPEVLNEFQFILFKFGTFHFIFFIPFRFISFHFLSFSPHFLSFTFLSFPLGSLQFILFIQL